MNKPVRSYIEICYTCNSDCISCPCPTALQKQGMLAFDKLKEYLDGHTGPGSVVNINGGEPTIHPDFIKIVDYATRAGARVGLLSNGRMFCDKKFAQSVVKAGLKDACIAFHSSNRAAYEGFTRAKGSFNEVVQGLKNLLELKASGREITVVLKILICKSTVKYLPETIRFITRGFTPLYQEGKKRCVIPDTILLEAMDIVCAAEENKGLTLITLTEAMPYINEAIEIGLAHRQNISIHYIPPCIFPNPDLYCGLVQRDPPGSQVVLGPERYIEDFGINSSAVKSLVCKECEADSFCAGVWKSYGDAVGLAELKPIKKLKLPPWLRKV